MRSPRVLHAAVQLQQKPTEGVGRGARSVIHRPTLWLLRAKGCEYPYYSPLITAPSPSRSDDNDQLRGLSNVISLRGNHTMPQPEYHSMRVTVMWLGRSA
jgi:hypothetical protein